MAPVPILSGQPERLPAWLLNTTAGIPNLCWALVVTMAALVLVALAASGAVDETDN